MTDTDNARTLLDAGAAAGNPGQWAADTAAPDVVTLVVPTGYQLTSFDVARALAPHLPAPKRVRGTVVVTDGASWLDYFAKHGTPASEVYGDVNASTVTAILNAPSGPTAPAWGDHRAILQLRHSAAWDAWTKLDGNFIGQEAFAEHIEARTPDLVDPDAATMLELAQSFQATKGVQFESGSRLANGERRFQYLESIEGKAGQRGELTVPTSIKIRVQVWRGMDIAVEMTARFRFRISPQGLALGYVLDRLDDILDVAWEDLLSGLTEKLPVPVLAGKAPTYA